MQSRTRLRDVKLVGARAWIRHLSFGATIALSVTGAVGYLLPAHMVRGEWHSNLVDGGPLPLVVFGALVAIALLLSRRGFGAGIAMSVLSTIGAIILVALPNHTHVDDRVLAWGVGQAVFIIPVLGLFIGVLFVFLDPVLYLTQRSANEQGIPVARVHN